MTVLRLQLYDKRLCPTFLVLLLLLHTFTVTACKETNSSSPMVRLKEHLFKDYDGLVRPVKDGVSPTIVTFRMLLYALLDMDTRNQYLKVATWVKMIWIDEFLTWNTTEFGGIDVIHVPSDRLWKPDITLQQNVEETFERYKPNTYINIYPDGNVIWYVPTIFGSSCRQRVRYFPFDTQACKFTLGSWAYDGLHIDLRADNSADAEQNRFLSNGVWRFITVKTRREVIKYTCCPAPYYELVYTIIFRRNSSFYVAYLILPCVFLSALSLLVFYLPPDCGEKLTLSITNLLALVVFQQLIAETMPPSGEESPMIGTFFLIMIVMVCISVVFTVLVIHIGFKKTKMPRWVQLLVIDCLGKCVCIKNVSSNSRTPPTLNGFVYDNQAMEGEKSRVHRQQNGDSLSLKNHYTDNGTEHELQSNSNELSSISTVLLSMNKEIEAKSIDDHLLSRWRLVSMIIDRVLMLTFTMFAVIVTIVMTTYVIVMSDVDFETVNSPDYIS